MKNTILLIISIGACLAGGILKKHSGNQFKNKQIMYHLFNAVVSFVSAASLFAMGGIGHISYFTLLVGIAFGIVSALQQIFTLKSYETGPFAYTAVIVSLSTIIPTLSGYFIWGESIAFIQIIGILLMLVCMTCSVDFGHYNHTKSSAKWLINAIVAFVCTGMIGVMQKFHQNSDFKAELNGFLIVAFAISFVYSAVSFFIISSKQISSVRQFTKTELKPYTLVIMVICGMCAALNNKINLYLSGIIDSAIFFPIVNGANLILTAIASVLIFKEKLSLQKWIGMAIGIIAVILLCNPF
ncbi:MAG: hypothetical protein E7410_00250 [Ruminococcaceae bacterium]|nr:hypothetical protein [Oscillospiraceae bacterium]